MSTKGTPTPTAEFDGERREVQRVLDPLPTGREGLLPALLAVQETFGYLPEHALEYVAEDLAVPLADVLGVATFYSQFSLQPQGEHVIRVCMGTACHVNGAEDCLDRLRAELDVLPGEVTEDGAFTLTTVRCLGACGLAPVILVDDQVHGDMDPADAAGLVDEYGSGGD